VKAHQKILRRSKVIREKRRGGFRPPVRPSVNYYNFSLDLSINGRMVISIQQRQQFAQITYNCNYKKKNTNSSRQLLLVVVQQNVASVVFVSLKIGCDPQCKTIGFRR
jgi:hypothetical protein